MQAITKKEMTQLWTSGAAILGIAAVCFLLSGCDIPGYKPHSVASGTDSTSGRSADTQAAFASEGVRTGGTKAPSTTGTSLSTTPASTSVSDGEAAFRSGRFADAVGVFSAYTDRKPENAYGHYMLGLSAWKAGDNVRAETELTTSVSLDSLKVKGWINLARVLLDEQKGESALANAERAVALDSMSGEGYRVLGRAKSQLGDVDGAVEAYRRATKIDDRDGWTLNDLGVLLMEKDRAGEALGP
ncbi:MAG TPA: tetratricopeptide repeat protein, partial [Gemmatimonadales bacterium]